MRGRDEEEEGMEKREEGGLLWGGRAGITTNIHQDQ